MGGRCINKNTSARGVSVVGLVLFLAQFQLGLPSILRE